MSGNLPTHGVDEDLMRRASPQFIAELAAKINEPSDILEKYGISMGEFRFLRELNSFRVAYKEAKLFWNSDANAKERIAVKAGMLVEDTLLDVFDIIKNADANLAARLDAFKQLKEIAGVDARAQAAGAGGGNGQRVFIDINFGGASRISRETEVNPVATVLNSDE